MLGPFPELKWLNRWQLSYLGGRPTVPFSLRLPPTPLGCSFPCPGSAHLSALRQDINLNEAARPVSYQL